MRGLALLCIVQFLLIAVLAVLLGTAWCEGGAGDRVSEPARTPRVEADDPLPARTPRTSARAVVPSHRRDVEPGSREGGASDGEDPIGCIVFGRVLGADGAPLAGAVVRFEAGAGHSDRVVQHGSTGYAVAGLLPGPHEWRVTAPGHLAEEGEVTITSAGSRVRLDLRLDAERAVDVLVRTTAGQSWFELARERRRRGEERPPAFRVVPTSAMCSPGDRAPPDDRRFGRWVAEPRAPQRAGQLLLGRESAARAVLVSADRVVAVAELAGAQSVEFVVDPAVMADLVVELSVRVVDEAQRPIRGALVWFWSGDQRAADAQGRVTFTGLPPKVVPLRVEADGYEHRVVAIDLRSGMDVDRTVELSRRRTLAVRVTSPAGVVAECAVVATPWSEVQQAPHAWVRHHAVATSLDDGRIEFTRLGDRRYLLRAVVAGFAPASIVVDAAVVSPDHPIDLSVRTGFPVTLRSGSERRGTVDVVIARSDRVPVWADDVRGSVELLLEPGRYVMSVDAGADAVEEHVVEIGPGENVFTWE